MRYLIYKTTHVSGKYYIGRHQTENVNDGYLGSGDWVKSIKDKSKLTRQIIDEASSLNELCILEESYIAKHFDDPLNMNYKRGSDGNTSEDAIEIAKRRVENGTHNFLGGEISGSVSRERVSNGTHNFLGPSSNKKRIDDGIHNWVGGEFQREQQLARVRNGTHHFSGGEISSRVSRSRVENGTHHFLGGDISRKTTKKRIDDGSHHFQQVWKCPHCGKTGKGTGLFARWHGDNCKSINNGVENAN